LYDFGIAFDIEDRLLELGADGVDGFEGVILEDFLADFIPEIFLGVELWRIGRQEEQRDIIVLLSAIFMFASPKCAR
jgi:hypothetical protein